MRDEHLASREGIIAGHRAHQAHALPGDLAARRSGIGARQHTAHVGKRAVRRVKPHLGLLDLVRVRHERLVLLGPDSRAVRDAADGLDEGLGTKVAKLVEQLR